MPGLNYWFPSVSALYLRCNPDSNPTSSRWQGQPDVTETAIQSLPPRIRLRLDQTLAQWRSWQCDPPLDSRPEPAEVLGRGISNFSVLVDAGQRFVVRIDGIDPAANGLHRQLEWRALQAASLAQLAPPPRYFNPELGSLVCDYLTPDPFQSQAPGEVGELLNRITELCSTTVETTWSPSPACPACTIGLIWASG